MNYGRTIFSQLMDFIPSYEYCKCVEQYNGNYKVKNLSLYRPRFPGHQFGIMPRPRELRL